MGSAYELFQENRIKDLKHFYSSEKNRHSRQILGMMSIIQENLLCLRYYNAMGQIRPFVNAVSHMIHDSDCILSLALRIRVLHFLRGKE